MVPYVPWIFSDHRICDCYLFINDNGINHSFDASCRLTSSTIWHLLPLSLIHLNDKQLPLLIPSMCPPLCILWSGPNYGPHLSYQSSDPSFDSSFISTLFYLICLSTLNNTVWKYLCYLSLNCVFIREGLEPSFVIPIQLQALYVLLGPTNIKVNGSQNMKSLINSMIQIRLATSSI